MRNVCSFPAALCLLLPAVWSQEAEPLRLSVTTRLVQVSVVVEGKGGRPVDDLTKDDFVILDGGVPQKITSFVRSAGVPPAPAAAPQPADAPRTWSNRGDSAAMPRTATALVFDGLNTSVKDQVFMKDHTLRFLRRLRPGDSAALYLITNELRILHDFTDDGASLIRALENEHPKVLAQWSRESVGGVMRGLLRRGRALYTLEALRAVSAHLGRIPGRKNLVWLTTGFPTAIVEMENLRASYIHDLRPAITATARAIGDADVTLYPVSALGLVGTPEISAAGRTPAAAGGDLRSTILGPQITHSRQTGPLKDMMTNLAQQTGGRAYTDRNDLDVAIQQALRDMRATYTLAFQPSHDKWDGDYRQIRVQVKRKGLKLRHRPGYVAAPDAPADDRDAAAVLMEAIDNPLDSTGVGVWVTPGDGVLHLRVDARTITLEPAGERWKGELLVALVPLASENGPAQPQVQTIAIDLSRERYEEVMKTGAAFDSSASAGDLARGVRVFVLDVASRRAGSVNVRCAH
jgi:VWFA-related protein